LATTISTSQTYDSAARTAGDTYTITSGATFTIDSDTRDGKNAPASRAGSMSSFTMTAATGGTVLLDGSKVWIIDYDGRIGTPNVPALGTIIAGVTSGAYGELMNISATIATTPTAAGSAMPATGIIKLKSITGTFQDNETLEIQGSTDLCLANGIGRRGWIEVVMDDAAGITIGRAQKWQATGDWFVSATTTSGSRHQQIQFPNYGGANFFLPGCWIQQPDQSSTYVLSGNVVTVTYTAHGYGVGQQVELDFTSGTGVDGLYTIVSVPSANTYTVALTGTDTSGNVTASIYEYYPGVLSGTGSPWATTALGTDARSKFVQCLAGGIIRIGGDGSNSIGDLPASGRKVKVPNIFLKSAATASRASDSVPNATLASRPDFTVTNAGQIDMEYCIGHWQMLLGQAFSVRLHHFALFDRMDITETASPLDLNDGGCGLYNISTDGNIFVLTSNFAGGTIQDWRCGRSGTIASADYGWNVTYCNNITFRRCHFQNRTFRTNAGGHPFYAAYCGGLIFTDCVVVGCSLYLLACADTTITRLQYADSYHTTSSSTTPPVGVIQLINGTSDTMIDGFSWYTSVANMHPDLAAVYLSAAYGVQIRNIGTYSVPLTAGSSNAMLYFCDDAGNSQDIIIKRVYLDLIATTFYRSINSTKNVEIANCDGNQTSYKVLTSAALNQIIKNIGITTTTPASTASIYGSIFYHHFTSTSAGRLGLRFNEDTAEYSAYVTKSFSTSATGTSGFDSTQGLALINSGDYAIFEFPYTIKGIDSFQNSAPTVTTSTNMTIEYQIDTGSGYGGSWKTFNASNLSGETVDETTGFKFKIKCSCNSTAAANLLTVLYCLTNSNTTAQAIQYPLDTYVLTLTGFQSGSDVVIYAAGTTTVRNSVDSATSYTYTYETPEAVDIGIFKAGYIPFYIRNYTLLSADASLPIAQTIDRAYLE
jgi:hypothetical protein